MGDATVSLNVMMTPAQKAALKRYCDDNGLEMSAFVRQLIFKKVDRTLLGDMRPEGFPKGKKKRPKKQEE